MNKIIIIENQITQHKKIENFLSEKDFKVFPDRTSHKSFLDLIRIYLNPRYGVIQSGSKRDEAFINILEIIKRESPLLIIIDHYLVGNHQAHDGIDLAKRLRDSSIDAPILFFSRNHSDDFEVLKKYPDIKGTKDWINKKDSKGELLNNEYLNSFVWEKIKNLILEFKKTETDNYITILDKIFEFECIRESRRKTELQEKINNIKESGEISQNQKAIIDNFYMTSDKNSRAIDNFIDKI